MLHLNLDKSGTSGISADLVLSVEFSTNSSQTLCLYIMSRCPLRPCSHSTEKSPCEYKDRLPDVVQV